MATGHSNALGPEIEGMRITVQTLLPHFLDAGATEASICQLYDLTPEQVAAARAYVLNNADVVLGEYLEIEERLAAGNPKQVIDVANETRSKLQRFKEWMAQNERAESSEDSVEERSSDVRSGSGSSLTFKQWLAEREARPAEGS